jgi:hypothetical protein
MEEDLRVDGTDHTTLAVLRLRAVEPHGLGVHDTDCVGEEVVGGHGRCVRGHEAGEEGGRHVRHDVLNGYAGLVEGRLDNRVVLENC